MEFMLALYRLADGVSPAQYGAWARDAEARLLDIVPGIERYGLFLLEPPGEHAVLETTDLSDWRSWARANEDHPAMRKLLGEWTELTRFDSTGQLFADRLAGGGLGRAPGAPAPGTDDSYRSRHAVAALLKGGTVSDAAAKRWHDLAEPAARRLLGDATARLSVYRVTGAPGADLEAWALDRDVVLTIEHEHERSLPRARDILREEAAALLPGATCELHGGAEI